jgi:hypothetical protein
VETFILSPLNGKRPLVLPIGSNFLEVVLTANKGCALEVMKHLRRGDRKGIPHPQLFQVTKGNKFQASEALSGAFAFERGCRL